MKGSLSAKKINSQTGRTGQVLRNNLPTEYDAIVKLAQYLSSLDKPPNWWLVLLRYPVAWKIFFEIGRVITLGFIGTYYRARKFPQNSSPPLSGEFGPPPIDKQHEGRYTDGKNRALYLSRSPQIAAEEIEVQDYDAKIFYQCFHLNLPSTKAMLLTEGFENIAPHLHYLLLESEYLPNRNAHYPHPYRPTQFLVFLCKLYNVEAIEYPSVRTGYAENPSAVNLVLLGETIIDNAMRMTKNHSIEYEEKINANKDI